MTVLISGRVLALNGLTKLSSNVSINPPLPYFIYCQAIVLVSGTALALNGLTLSILLCLMPDDLTGQWENAVTQLILTLTLIKTSRPEITQRLNYSTN